MDIFLNVNTYIFCGRNVTYSVQGRREQAAQQTPMNIGLPIEPKHHGFCYINGTLHDQIYLPVQTLSPIINVGLH